MTRADRNNNPAAFTTDIAKEAGLILGVDYIVGDVFQDNNKLYTAKLLKDPIDLTIKVIDKITYYTRSGKTRWNYIAIPKFIWELLTYEEKKQVIKFHYRNEGGTELLKLWL